MIPESSTRSPSWTSSRSDPDGLPRLHPTGVGDFLTEGTVLNFYKIQSHPNYSITRTGEVRNDKTGRILKHSEGSSSGYLTVYVDGKNLLLHRLLAETFIDNPLQKKCVNHIDGNKQNNNLTNLEWCTYKENLLHARKTGLNPYQMLYGEKSRHHKLTQKEVIFIKRHYKPYDIKFGAKALSLRFNVTSSCISMICKGKNWAGDVV